MSRMRIEAKVRCNPDYKACTAYLDGLGLPWDVLPPTGKGHPKLAIRLPSGAVYHHPIACSPSGRLSTGRVLATLRRGLARVMGSEE